VGHEKWKEREVVTIEMEGNGRKGKAFKHFLVFFYLKKNFKHDVTFQNNSYLYILSKKVWPK